METLFEGALKQSFLGERKIGRNMPQNTPFFDANPDKNSSSPRKGATEGESRGAKTSLRLKYEAEAQSIRKTCGDLEAIRRHLGLSKRKMAQLLLVDPSAWTRWTQVGGEAPPHIYRALQWFLLLKDQNSEMTPYRWLAPVSQPTISQTELDAIKKQLLFEILEERKEDRKKLRWAFAGLGIFIFLQSIWILLGLQAT